MGHHRSRRLTSSDSGYDTNSDRPSSPAQERRKADLSSSQSSLGSQYNSQNSSLSSSFVSSGFNSLSSARRVDVTPSIGTHLHNIQLSTLTHQQLDELAHLVSERGVVFLHDQDLSKEEQLRISAHYGAATASGTRIIERSPRFVKVQHNLHDHGENFHYAAERKEKWASESSFEENPTSYSLLKASGSGPDMIWVSQYGLYDTLSTHMKGFLDNLQALHTSSLQYSSIANLRGSPATRSPIETTHPAVVTHPVTGLKALNVTPGHVSSFNGLTPRESKKLIELLTEQIDDALSEHSVRFAYEAGSVAIWDNRCTARKVVPGWREGVFNCFETVVVGEKPSLTPSSTSRVEKAHNTAHAAKEARKAKATYNNTPLRRILRRQTTNGLASSSDDESGAKDVATPAAPTASNQQHGEDDPVPATQDATGVEVVEQAGDKGAEEDPVIVVEKTCNAQNETSIRVQVTFRGSPLRRIIQRQTATATPPS